MTTPAKFTIQFRRWPGGIWYAFSTDITGLFLAEPTLEALFREIPRAMAELDEARAALWWASYD